MGMEVLMTKWIFWDRVPLCDSVLEKNNAYVSHSTLYKHFKLSVWKAAKTKSKKVHIHFLGLYIYIYSLDGLPGLQQDHICNRILVLGVVDINKFLPNKFCNGLLVFRIPERGQLPFIVHTHLPGLWPCDSIHRAEHIVAQINLSTVCPVSTFFKQGENNIL